MLQLKYAHELTWRDLKYLETPRDALRTIERVHGSKFTNESIWNAHRHSLPKFNTHKVHNGYNTIKNQLENSNVFLINHSTLSPIIQTLELKECGHEVEWSLRSYVNNVMRNTLCMAIERVEKPKTVGVLRSTPAQNTSQNTTTQQGPIREQHRILLEVESEDDRPLPDRHNVTLFVENTTKGRRAANQKHDVIVNQISRQFSAEKGDALKTYVIPSTQNAVLEDLRSNSNVQQSESEGLISALTETGQEVEADGTILHHFTYKVPGKTTFKMMRIKQTPHTTISELTVEHDPSKKWYVLEAGGPDSKVSGKGRIEKGTYQLTPYSSSNYPSEFQLKQVPGRTNIIMYEYGTSTKLTTGLALGKSYDFSDDTKQHYKVDGSADAKKEIYDMIGDGEAEIVIESQIKEKISLKGKRIKETDNTTLTELWEEDNPNKKWYMVEPAGPDSSDYETGLRVPAGGPYELKMFSKQSGEYRNSIEVKDVEGRNKVIIAKAISYKERDPSALFYIGSDYELDESLQIFELTESQAALDELVALMKSVRKSELTLENDASIDNTGDSLTVSEGQFTFDVEGDDYYRGSPSFSRIPHVPGEKKPTNYSGITIGRGTDLGQQTLSKSDFESAGIESEFAAWLAGAKGKQGSDARAYLAAIPENLKGKVITRAAQKKLFESLIDTYVDRAKKYFDGEPDSNGFLVSWEDVDSDIKEILVDMSYRGELKSKLVKKIFDMVSGTEKSKLASFVGDPMSFKGIVETLPDKNRCKNRKEKLS